MVHCYLEEKKCWNICCTSHMAICSCTSLILWNAMTLTVARFWLENSLYNKQEKVMRFCTLCRSDASTREKCWNICCTSHVVICSCTSLISWNAVNLTVARFWLKKKTAYIKQIKVMRFCTLLGRSDASNKHTDWLCATDSIFLIIESIVRTINTNTFQVYFLMMILWTVHDLMRFS